MPDVIAKWPITKGVLALTNQIAECRGKQALYQRQIPQVLDTLREHAVIQSTESSNRIEGIVVPTRRFHSIMRHASDPQTRSEAEIAGYRDVLKMIHEHHEYMRLTPNLILQLHRDLMKYTGTGGKWKITDNYIEEVSPSGERRIRFQTVPAWQTPSAVEELCRLFHLELQRGEWPDVLVIAAFVLDFLCIHPFVDGNGRMARLLALLLLYQSGYVVGRYISLERVIEDTKEQYYDTLYSSSQGWHQGEHNLTPWVEYFLTMLLEAYRRFEQRVGDTEAAQHRGWKSERIRSVVQGFVADFSISDVEELCPGISRPMITRVLNELSRQGVIECIQRGRNARWKRCEPMN
ncbi:MAG: Fic family protein [Alicyclobacillus sp.]|nr:Fic family protein [Alicyclobacillus sp.]